MRNVILLTLVIFFLFMASGVTNPVTSLYSRELGANYAMIAMLGTVGSVTSLAVSYLWGHLSDRTSNRKRLMAAGIATMVVTRALVAVVPSYVYLFPLRIIEAVAMAAYGVNSLALMGDVLERDKGRGTRMGIYRGLASLGFGLMAFFAGSIADRFGLHVPFIFSSAFLAISFLLTFLVKDVGRAVDEDEDVAEATGAEGQAPGTTKPAATEKAGAPTRRLPMTPLLVSALVWSLVTGAVYSVWANYMVEELQYTPTIMTRLWSVASTSELVFMILAGWLSDRVGRLPMLAFGFILWALVFSGYLVIPMLPWIILVQLTRGFAYSAYTATAMTYATEVRSRKARGRASGLYSSAGGLGSILGAVAGGSLVQWLGFKPMIAICASLTLLAAIYIGIVAVQWRRGEPSVEATLAQA